MGVLTCMDCGVKAERSGGMALRCLPCANKPRARIAANGRTRHGAQKPIKVGESWACVDCAALMPSKVVNGRKWPPALRCGACRAARAASREVVRARANRAVARAIGKGELPKPAGQRCADCGRPASFYDHRDYTQPLRVEPVCRSCNVMRGPADVWPSLAKAA